jgi:hypothetical protein
MESTGNGQSGMFYNMCKQAQSLGIRGPWRLHFLPWTLAPDYRTPHERIPQGWTAPREFADYARMHGLDFAQTYWFWEQNWSVVGLNGGNVDEIHRITRQEYPIVFEDCFTADSTFDFYPPSLVAAAMGRAHPPRSNELKILACDPSLQGGDGCWIGDRQGNVIGSRIWGDLKTGDQNVQADWLVAKVQLFNFDALCVDATGIGIGLVSALRLRKSKLGACQIIPVIFGAGASNPQNYGNRRAEILDRAGARLKHPDTRLPNDAKLSEEYAAYKWSQGGCRRDDVQRLFMTPKEKIRADIGRSPDRLDCCALLEAIDA